MSDSTATTDRTPLRRFLRTAAAPFYEFKRRVRRRSALFWRRRCGRTNFIGITGSHGKTTTTALLGATLATLAPTYVNNSGGNTRKTVVRTVLRTLPWHHRFSVQEVGADKAGSVGNIVAYLQPTVGIVTEIGGDHRRAFGGTREAIAAEKAKLVHSLPTEGLAVLNADDPLVAAMAAGCACRVVTFGRAADADLRLLKASAPWPERLTLEVEYRGKPLLVKTRLVGAHWAVSVMPALLTALELGADRAACLGAIESFEPVFNRMSVHQGPRGAWYVLDANKASFFGIEACLGFLDEAAAPRKTVVFGTISDYPGASRSHYYKVARAALDRADRVIFTGSNSSRVRRLAAEEFAGRLFVRERPQDVLQMLSEDAVPDEIIYVKATRVDRLARVFVPAR
jgi:UDP-N-acetylmuramoyl-tripeptide--D-alanyl-D-alanine ligase